MHIYAYVICYVLCVFVKTVKTQKQIKYKKKNNNKQTFFLLPTDTSPHAVSLKTNLLSHLSQASLP